MRRTRLGADDPDGRLRGVDGGRDADAGRVEADRDRPRDHRPGRRPPDTTTAATQSAGQRPHRRGEGPGAGGVGRPEFVDAAPAQAYVGLLDQGGYVGSISTMYRILREHAQVKERRRLAKHPARTRPELVATGPGQVYAWDITKLAGPVKGCYYDAYVMIDIYSRYIVGARVHAREDGALARR